LFQEESNHALLNPASPNSDDSNVLVNASDARKFPNCGKAPMNTGKGNTRHCTVCDKRNMEIQILALM
jgi:hypothetical protein